MQRHSILAIAIFLQACINSGTAGASDDHLVQPYSDRDWGAPGYASSLQKKLVLTTADYGRVLVRPSPASIGEYVISVYSADSGKEAHITLTRAGRNLWYQHSYQKEKTVSDDPYASSAPIKVTRIDATLPVSTARAIRSAWAEMLRGTAGKWPGQGNRIVLDGTDIEFSLIDGGKKMTGVIAAGATGKNTLQLRKLSELLERYCTAPPSQRRSIASQMETKAKHLVRERHAR
jgi:hypothetical protein